MAGVSRYSTGGDESDLFKNKLGITDIKELQYTEAVLLRDAYDCFLVLLNQGKLKFSLSLLFKIHDYFLGTIYSWAGKIRTVNISKEDTFFIPAQNIENALKQFESDFKKNKPTHKDSKKEISKKLAFIHCELNVIHPFREGNGRTLRLFLDLLTIQAGYKAVDFKKISNKEYIDACQKGMLKNYEPMEKIYIKLLLKTA